MSQADGHDGLSRNGGARVSSNGRDWWPVCAGCIPDGWPRRGLHRPARVSQGAARGVEVKKGRAPVTPEPTCTECRRRPRWAGSLWCEPCYVRLGIMDGTAAFSDAMARLGESAS